MLQEAISGVSTKTSDVSSLPAVPVSVEKDPVASKSRARIAPPLLPAPWRTALGALRRNKMRSGLSALGVIIAVAAVIAMTEIGQGSKASLQKGIASMGANTLMISPGPTTPGGLNLGAGTMVTLSPQDAEEIAKQCTALEAVAPTVRARSQIVYKTATACPSKSPAQRPRSSKCAVMEP